MTSVWSNNGEVRRETCKVENNSGLTSAITASESVSIGLLWISTLDRKPPKGGNQEAEIPAEDTPGVCSSASRTASCEFRRSCHDGFPPLGSVTSKERM